ncbi:hypothetical protein MOC16_gp155 [Klebsiella phage vB_KpM_FBKp24]|uniref:Uncharacterized protein n=1 Tax=Klebsiella phage vB_KpM_FBKp24 TaxID=2801834 RepID=A0A7U0J5E1_9CAUD|nr:hypothetical protein MOC16_gp155 [Klebsiella phage vB_KpM_FBKp24]QQV92158.1 hypothetical protein vBKpMFBKp24_258 [Klebsiella phage vB_KpM_FBKp24]
MTQQIKLKFERGVYAADAYGLTEGEIVAHAKNAAGETILLPAFAEMVDEAEPGEELRITDYNSCYQPESIKWGEYQKPYRYKGVAVVAADGVVWQWSLDGLDGETFAKYLERLGDAPRDLVSHFRNQQAITFRIPQTAVAYNLKRLLATGLKVNLIDPDDLGELDTLSSGIHAINFYSVYWVFTK